MKKILITTSLIGLLVIAPVRAEYDFSGFEYCTLSDHLMDSRKKIINDHKPSTHENNFVEYSIEGEILGQQFKKVTFGTCSKDFLDTECGNINFVGFWIDDSLAKVKESLKKKYGIDFSEENLESDLSLPHLVEDSKSSSVIYCSTGSF